MDSTTLRKKTRAEIPLNNALKASEYLLLARRGTVLESFHCAFPRPPVYRAPSFPVFFYAGNRKYNQEMSSSGYVKDELHQIVSSPPPEVKRLAQLLHNIGDELPEDDRIRLVCALPPTPPITYFTLLRTCRNSLIACHLLRCLLRRLLHRLLRPLNIFTRNHGSDHHAPEEMEQHIILQKKSAGAPLPGRSHLLPAPDCIQSRRGSSCSSQELSDQISDPLDTDDDDGLRFNYIHTGDGENRSELSSVPSDCEAAGDSDALVKMEAPVTAVKSSVTNTQPTRPHLQLSSDPGRSQRGSSCLPRSHSVPSLSQISSAENKTLRPSESLPDLLLKSSFEEFTPDVTVDENDETYRFLCSCPGLYQCSVTGLVFHMEGEGHVVYRVVSWDRRLLAQHHKKPAGPLFDIKCLQQSVCRLHLPHCEIRSTAGCGFLSVAHVKDESIEFIPPHKITETHVIINITGFSGFGNVKDEDSPLFPVRALVLLFYRPPDDQDLESLLNVLMLPGNVVLRNVRRTRKINVGDELYIETSSHCKLLPKQEYTLSTCPEDDSVLVQPKEAEFDEESYDNYIPSFQVDLEKILKHIKLFLRDTNRHSVWERRVCLSTAGLKKSCGQSALNLPPNKKLFDVRSSFIEGISGPVLKSLLDKLLEKTVLTDPEREEADEMQNRRDKACFVIDTVRKKGEAASSEMIEILCELDPFLCEHLGLI
ncbi:uncharacterized protein [Pagrus major]|uniref:uncharacterized protein n=1 Tax=Pagrus major TaxID=143350 RepID=UPI003CC8A2B8